MKKVILFAVAGIFAFGLSSYKKDWDCDCKSANPNLTTTGETYVNVSKKDATNACDAYETSSKTYFPDIDCKVTAK